MLSLVSGWLIAGRFVRPLRAIITTAKDISASNLHHRLGVRGRGDEFTELGETLDDLFGRLEAAFQAQRHFIANASHELRTPLSAGRALLQVAIADPEPTVETLRATCQELVELGDQQERLIAALLALASSQRGIGELECLALAAAPVTGDASLAESLVANLLDNAIRHNLPGGQVEISTSLTAAGAVVSVGNTGTVIPPDAVEDLFQPFRQLGTQRTRRGAGHGLGLAIVRAIADAHNAALTARARPGGGLDIQVTFPPARPVRGRPQKADGYADRATGTDAVRYTSVDAATQRPTALQGDTPRDREETARIADVHYASVQVRLPGRQSARTGTDGAAPMRRFMGAPLPRRGPAFPCGCRSRRGGKPRRCWRCPASRRSTRCRTSRGRPSPGRGD